MLLHAIARQLRSLNKFWKLGSGRKYIGLHGGKEDPRVQFDQPKTALNHCVW